MLCEIINASTHARMLECSYRAYQLHLGGIAPNEAYQLRLGGASPPIRNIGGAVPPSELLPLMYTYVHMYMHIYIYIYMYMQ